MRSIGCLECHLHDSQFGGPRNNTFHQRPPAFSTSVRVEAKVLQSLRAQSKSVALLVTFSLEATRLFMYHVSMRRKPLLQPEDMTLWPSSAKNRRRTFVALLTHVAAECCDVIVGTATVMF